MLQPLVGDTTQRYVALARLEEVAQGRQGVLQSGTGGTAATVEREAVEQLLRGIVEDGATNLRHAGALKDGVRALLSKSDRPLEDRDHVLEELARVRNDHVDTGAIDRTARARHALLANKPHDERGAAQRDAVEKVLNQVLIDGDLVLDPAASAYNEIAMVFQPAHSLLYASGRPVAEFEWIRTVIAELADASQDKQTLLSTLESTARGIEDVRGKT